MGTELPPKSGCGYHSVKNIFGLTYVIDIQSVCCCSRLRPWHHAFPRETAKFRIWLQDHAKGLAHPRPIIRTPRPRLSCDHRPPWWRCHRRAGSSLARFGATLSAAESRRLAINEVSDNAPSNKKKRGGQRKPEPHSERPAVIAAIRLLLFTGCRVGEILFIRPPHPAPNPARWPNASARRPKSDRRPSRRWRALCRA